MRMSRWKHFDRKRKIPKNVRAFISRKILLLSLIVFLALASPVKADWSSENYWNCPISLPNTVPSAFLRGDVITMINNARITQITKASTSVLSGCYILTYPANATVDSSDWIGDTCNFTGSVILNASDSYILAWRDNPTLSYDLGYSNTNSTDISVIGFIEDTTGSWGSVNPVAIADIYNITSQNYTAPTNGTNIYLMNKTWSLCSDNETLHIHEAKYDNGTFSYSNDSYIICDSGCSDAICNPPIWQQGLIYLGIVLFFAFIVGLAFKRRRK
jgi:hypothetical protein